MKELNNHWDEIHKKYKSTYDNWLDNYIHLINKNDKIIELGCGLGYTSIYLMNNGYTNIIATDFSKEALNIINKTNPSLNTMILDITAPFPFKDNEINVIIADLCLHYFSTEKTKSILKEIKRVLKPNGYLIGRVNSVKDTNYIPNGTMLENNFYFDGTIYKKFYTYNDLKELFKDYKIISLEEKIMTRYEKPKTLFEFCIKKLDS